MIPTFCVRYPGLGSGWAIRPQNIHRVILQRELQIDRTLGRYTFPIEAVGMPNMGLLYRELETMRQPIRALLPE
jgi:hypothetical protein